MESIRKYASNFFKKHEENIRFTMNASELLSAARFAKAGNAVQAISDIFSYGYAKGYRACQAEMKKGGMKA